MTNAEAVGTVHRMMEAREQEEARTAALASQVATKKTDQSEPAKMRWRRFWTQCPPVLRMSRLPQTLSVPNK